MKLQDAQLNYNVLSSIIFDDDILSTANELKISSLLFDNSKIHDVVELCSDTIYFLKENETELNDHRYIIPPRLTRRVYGQNAQTYLYVDEEDGTTKMNIQPGQYWSKVNTGINFSSSTTTDISKNSIKFIVQSKSDAYVYIGTTQGLYRTLHDDLTNCERILQDELIGATNTSDISNNSLILAFIEISPYTYAIFVAGFGASYATKLYIYDSTTNKIKRSYDKTVSDQWIYNTVIETNTDDSIQIICSTAAGPTFRVSINKHNFDFETNVLVNGTSSMQYLKQFNGHIFASKYHQDIKGDNGPQYGKGLSYYDGSSFNTIAFFNDKRIYNMNVVQYTNSSNITEERLFVCAYKDVDNSDNTNSIIEPIDLSAGQFSLYEVKVSGEVRSESYFVYHINTEDSHLSVLKNCREFYHSPTINKWIGIFADDPIYISGDNCNSRVYIADCDENHYWYNGFISTDFVITKEAHPHIYETDSKILINNITQDTNGNYIAEIESSSSKDFQKLAFESELKVKHIAIGEKTFKPDENGLVKLDDINLKLDDLSSNISSNVTYQTQSDNDQAKNVSYFQFPISATMFNENDIIRSITIKAHSDGSENAVYLLVDIIDDNSAIEYTYYSNESYTATGNQMLTFTFNNIPVKRNKYYKIKFSTNNTTYVQDTTFNIRFINCTSEQSSNGFLANYNNQVSTEKCGWFTIAATHGLYSYIDNINMNLQRQINELKDLFSSLTNS